MENTPQEREKLLAARNLLEQKRYEEARALLMSIAHHPTAAKWLAKLDDIAPRASTPPPPPPKQEPLQARVREPLPGQKPRVEDLGNYAPIDALNLYPSHPFSWLGCGLMGCGCFFGGLPIGTALYGALLSFNWPSYGRGKWVMPSCAMVLGIPLVMAILGSIFAYAIPISNFALSVSLGFSLLLGATLWAILSPAGVFYMQWIAYNAWESSRSSERLRNFSYPLGCVGGVVLLAIVPIMCFITFLGYQFSQPQTYEASQFNVTTTEGWLALPPSLSCPEASTDCTLLMLSYENANDWVLLMMLDNSNSFDPPSSLSEAEAQLREDITSQGNRITVTRDRPIDDVPAKAIEYQGTNTSSNPEIYGMFITFIHQGKPWVIFLVSPNQTSFERQRANFRPVLDSLDMK
jgi:hypothetical protein